MDEGFFPFHKITDTNNIIILHLENTGDSLAAEDDVLISYQNQDNISNSIIVFQCASTNAFLITTCLSLVRSLSHGDIIYGYL